MSRIEELEKQITELDERKVALQKELELEKQKTEIEYPFEEDEPYWAVKDEGYIQWLKWDNKDYDQPRYEQGHIFKTKQEAIRERDRRALLTRFRQFRDKCNEDWKPVWKEIENSYNYYIEMAYVNGHEKLRVDWSPCSDSFNLFGYFKNKEDAERAIELFGDEIKRLFVED